MKRDLDDLIMDNGVVGAEARSILNNTEDHAHLIENTAKGIFEAAHRFDRGFPIPAGTTNHAWNELAARERIRYRQQARAALAASELLKRVEDLEQRIADARSQLAFTGGRTAQHLAGAIDRADRVLSKPRPEPDPIGIKP